MRNPARFRAHALRRLCQPEREARRQENLSRMLQPLVRWDVRYEPTRDGFHYAGHYPVYGRFA